MKTSDLRYSATYKKMRALFIKECEQVNAPCALCGLRIQYDLPRGHKDAPTLDHIVPVSRASHLVLEKSNFQVTHNKCNAQKKNKTTIVECNTLPNWWIL